MISVEFTERVVKGLSIIFRKPLDLKGSNLTSLVNQRGLTKSMNFEAYWVLWSTLTIWDIMYSVKL